MGWSGGDGGGSDGEGPRTSWVKMPSRDVRATPAPSEPQPWAPVGQRPVEVAPRNTSPDAPFGGFEAGPTTGMMRRGADSGRFWAVLGVLVAVFGLGVVAVVVALKFTPAPTRTEGLTPPPPPPKEGVSTVDDAGSAEQDALNHTKDATATQPTTPTKTPTKTTTTHRSTSGARTTKKTSRTR